MSGLRSQARVGLVVIVALLTITGMFAGAGAATISALGSGSPADIPGNSDDASQVIADGSNTIDFDSDKSSSSVAIKIDISDLVDAGADISDAQVTDGSGSSGFSTEGDAGSPGFSNVDVEDQEIQLVVTGTTGDKNNNGIINGLALSGIDTSNVDTAQNLEYVIRADDQNGGDFGSSFSTDTIATTSPFSVATVEVENLDTGTTVTEASISEAIAEANDLDSGDLDDGAADNADQVEIRPNEGTYVFANEEIKADNTRITPIGDSDVTFENADSDPTLDIVGAQGVEIEGITFDQADTSQSALRLVESGSQPELTVSGATFENANGGTYIQAADGAGSLDVSDSTVVEADDDGTPNGISVENDVAGDDADGNLDLSVSTTEFDGLGTAINLGTSVTTNSESISDNTFGDNNIQVSDNGNAILDLTAIFQSNGNTFEEYAVPIDNVDDSVVRSNNELVGDLSAATDTSDFESDSTTILIAGEHSVGSNTIELDGNSEVTLTADSADATITVDGTVLDLDSDTDGADTDTVTVEGLVFEEIGGNGPVIDSTDGNSDVVDLSVTGNEFIGANGAADAVVDLGGTTSVEGLTINNNLFESDADSSNDYTAININELKEEDTTAVTVDISNNDIVNAENGVLIGNLNDDQDGVEVTIDSNTIVIEGSSLGQGIGDGQRAIEVTSTSSASNSVVDITNNELNTVNRESFITGIAVDDGQNDDFAATIESNEVSGYGAAIDIGSGQNTWDGQHTNANVVNNDLSDNLYHIRALESDYEVATLRADNNIENVVTLTDGDPAEDDTEILATASGPTVDIYGSIARALGDSKFASDSNAELGVGVRCKFGIAKCPRDATVNVDGRTTSGG